MIPPAGSLTNGRHRVYPFNELKKEGDSVSVPCDPRDPHKVRRIRDAAYRFAQYNGIRLATRLHDDGITVYYVVGARQ